MKLRDEARRLRDKILGRRTRLPAERPMFEQRRESAGGEHEGPTTRERDRS